LMAAVMRRENPRYVGLWHKADVQRLPGLGPLTGA
jgi:hypothetical protein